MTYLAIASIAWALITSLGFWKYYKVHKAGYKEGYDKGYAERDLLSKKERIVLYKYIKKLHEQGTALTAEKPDVPFDFQ